MVERHLGNPPASPCNLQSIAPQQLAAIRRNFTKFGTHAAEHGLTQSTWLPTTWFSTIFSTRSGTARSFSANRCKRINIDGTGRSE